MTQLIYTVLALFSTFIGSLTGMGGGIIMKPVMDLLGHYDSAAISILSSTAVFAMSAVNCGRRLIGSVKKRKKKETTESKGNSPAPDAETAPPTQGRPQKTVNLLLLALGSAAGGYLGQVIFDALTGSTDNVKRVQNIVMAVLVLFIFIYMLKKDKLPSPALDALPVYIVVGLLLGVISSFLGIGGGPVNVAALTLVFAMDIKTAVFASLLSVFFTQFAKLVTVVVTQGFSPFAQPMLPFIVIGAIVGATIGSALVKRLSPKKTNLLFCAVQVIIFAICVINAIVN